MLKQPACLLTFSSGLLMGGRIRSDPHCHVEVHERFMRQGSSAHCDAVAQADLTPTNLLAHLCHLHPACERTVSSAWLQPLCGRAITGQARPPLAGGGGVRRLVALCLCAAVCRCRGACTQRAVHFPVCEYLCLCG